MLEAKAQGKLRHIGITNHRLRWPWRRRNPTLRYHQFPFSYLANEKEIALVRLCREKNIGFIAMKALSGGLSTNVAAAYAFRPSLTMSCPSGVSRESRLDAFLACDQNRAVLDAEIRAVIERDKKTLAARSAAAAAIVCPAPRVLDSERARMSLLIRRAPVSVYLSPEWQDKMKQIETCADWGNARANAPTGLIAGVLRENLADYKSLSRPQSTEKTTPPSGRVVFWFSVNR
jgi:hypothetical protein